MNMHIGEEKRIWNRFERYICWKISGIWKKSRKKKSNSCRIVFWRESIPISYWNGLENRRDWKSCDHIPRDSLD